MKEISEWSKMKSMKVFSFSNHGSDDKMEHVEECFQESYSRNKRSYILGLSLPSEQR